jgi:hypothetical protein
MVRVTTLRRRVPQGGGLPGVNVSGSTAGAFAAAPGVTQVGNAVTGYALSQQQERDRLAAEQAAKDDRVASQRAVNDVMRARLSDFTTPDTGFDHLRGGALIQASEGASERFDQFVSERLQALSPEQQYLAQEAMDGERLQYRNRLNGQVGRARHAVATNTFESALALTRDSAVDAVGIYDGSAIGSRYFKRLRSTVDTYVADQSDQLEEDPELFRERLYRQEASRGAREIVERLIGLGELDQAQAFVETHGEQFEPGDGTALMSQMRTAAQADAVQRTASVMYQPADLAKLTTVQGQMAEDAPTPERFISDNTSAYREALVSEGVDEALLEPSVAAFERRMRVDLDREREAQLSEFAELQDDVLNNRVDGFALLSDPASLVKRFSQTQIDALTKATKGLQEAADDAAGLSHFVELSNLAYSPNPEDKARYARMPLVEHRLAVGGEKNFQFLVGLQNELRDEQLQELGGTERRNELFQMTLAEMGTPKPTGGDLRDAEKVRAYSANLARLQAVYADERRRLDREPVDLELGEAFRKLVTPEPVDARGVAIPKPSGRDSMAQVVPEDITPDFVDRLRVAHEEVVRRIAWSSYLQNAGDPAARDRDARDLMVSWLQRRSGIDMSTPIPDGYPPGDLDPTSNPLGRPFEGPYTPAWVLDDDPGVTVPLDMLVDGGQAGDGY